MPSGTDVKLSADGAWVDRSGRRVRAREDSKRSTVISMNNSDKRNGELAYQTAYDSYLNGKKKGLNQVQRVKNGGRWTRKITTGDGIVIFKDAAGNAAVQTPDGRWHVTDVHGEYASSSMELEREMPSSTMVAKQDVVPKKASEEGGGRKPASVSEIPEEKIAEKTAEIAEAKPEEKPIEKTVEKPAEKTEAVEAPATAPSAAVPASSAEAAAPISAPPATSALAPEAPASLTAVPLAPVAPTPVAAAPAAPVPPPSPQAKEPAKEPVPAPTAAASIAPAAPVAAAPVATK